MSDNVTIVGRTASISWLTFSRHLVAALIVSSIQPVSGHDAGDVFLHFLVGVTFVFGVPLILAAAVTGAAALFLTEATRQIRKAIFLWCMWIAVFVLLLIAWFEAYGLGEFTQMVLLSFLALAINSILVAFLAQVVVKRTEAFKPPYFDALKGIFFGALAGNMIMAVPEFTATLNGMKIIPVGYVAIAAGYVLAMVISLGHFVRTPGGFPIGFKRGAVVCGLLIPVLAILFMVAAGGALVAYKVVA